VNCNISDLCYATPVDSAMECNMQWIGQYEYPQILVLWVVLWKFWRTDHHNSMVI